MSNDDLNLDPKVWSAASARPAPDRGITGSRPARGAPSAAPGRRPGAPPVSWPLVLGLGAIALVRPLARITGADEPLGAPAGALALTVLVTVVWVAIVGLGRVPRPVLTLTLAGVAYGLAVIPLSAVASTTLTGALQGPVAVPFAIVPILVTNAAWGAVAGLLALAVRSLRGERS
ncbi:hypothetical protein [Georgenia daeguensis]|uniref:Tryptophan-rich sensory protein n=1 Tax=Georgenia daeguensis TaxID=908355 RepID=A0ABP8ESZ2_9MICO